MFLQIRRQGQISDWSGKIKQLLPAARVFFSVLLSWRRKKTSGTWVQLPPPLKKYQHAQASSKHVFVKLNVSILKLAKAILPSERNGTTSDPPTPC